MRLVAPGLRAALLVVAAVAAANGARGQEQQQAAGTSEQELVTALGQAAPDMEMIGEVRIGQLDERQETRVQVPLEQNRCYKMVAAGGPGVSDLSLVVLVNRQEVASDRVSGEHPMVKWCSPEAQQAEIVLTMYNGAGTYALVVYGEKRSGPTAVDKVGGSDTDFIANRVRQLHAQFGKDRGAISPLYRGNLSTSNEQVFKTRLKAGHCYTVIAVGSPSVRDLDIVLIDPAGREIARDTSRNNFPILTTEPCVREMGQYTLKVRMLSGFGQFGMQVFSD